MSGIGLGGLSGRLESEGSGLLEIPIGVCQGCQTYQRAAGAPAAHLAAASSVRTCLTKGGRYASVLYERERLGVGRAENEHTPEVVLTWMQRSFYSILLRANQVQGRRS
jgi:hypothetical protein